MRKNKEGEQKEAVVSVSEQVRNLAFAVGGIAEVKK